MGRVYSHLKIRYLVVFAFTLSVIFLVSSCSKNSTSSGSSGGNVYSAKTDFSDGTFDASGLIDVAGTDGVLFVDNKRKGQVLWMRLDQNGKQAEAVKPIDLQANIEDLEGMTADGTHFYGISSQSKPKAAAAGGMVRFKFDPATQSVSGVETISGLKGFLVENVAELRAFADTKGKDGGINIEGLGWDAQNKRFLIAMRSPVVDGNALLIPLRMRDARGAFALENLEVEGGKAIRLPLGGVGIRGIEYSARKGVYQLIGGATENQKQQDFGIWEWNGNADQPGLREVTRVDKDLKPEGVAHVTVGERDFTMLVFDASGYSMLD